MCNLYSITTNQAAIIALFRVINRYVGNLPPMSGVFPDYPAPVVRDTAHLPGASRGCARRLADLRVPANAGPNPRDFAELTRTTAMIKVAPASVRRTAADRTQPAVEGRFVLGRRASLLVSAGVVSHTLWTSAAPAPAYGVYSQGWDLTPTVTAGIFSLFSLVLGVM